MPFCHVRLRALKPLRDSYPADPQTLGESIRKYRIDAGLLQKELAERIGVSESTICNWEKGYTASDVHLLPRIWKVVGEPAQPPVGTLREALIDYRRRLGLSQRGLAASIGVDPSTVASWERGEHEPQARLAQIIGDLLEAGK